jgi:hypothetical protein
VIKSAGIISDPLITTKIEKIGIEENRKEGLKMIFIYKKKFCLLRQLRNPIT